MPAPLLVMGVVWVGARESRDEVNHAGQPIVDDRDHSEPRDGSRPLAAGRPVRGGMFPAPWGAWQSVLLPVFGILAVGIGVVVIGIVEALIGSDVALIGLDAVVLPVGMTGVIVGWIALRYRRAGLVRLFWPAPSLPAMTTARIWGVTAVTAAAYMLVLQWGLGTLVTRVAPELIGTQQDGFRDMAAGGTAEIVMLVVRVVIGAAVREEILFRGLLFAGLARRWGFWPGAIVSSVLFSAIHAASGAGSFVYLGTQTFLFGLIAAWLVRHTGRLWPAMVFHAANNAVGVILFVTAA